MKDLSDAQLVELYARKRDEGAFAEIARRHGPMVYAACRRSLGSGGTADDAAQAVFMLLARKADSLSRREALAGWLHGAASLVAREHLRAATRRRRAEKEAAEMRAASKSESSREWNSIRGELDAVIEKLPRHYRDAVLLSCVERRSEAEVARELKVPAGTVKSRVSRGLEKLRERLAQRGRVLGVGALAALLAEHGTFEMPAALATKVAGLGAAGAAAAGVGTASASLLMLEGALKAMMMFKIKVAAAVLGTVLVAGTAVPVAQRVIGAEPSGPAKSTKPATGDPSTAGPSKKPKPNPVQKPAKVAWGKAANGLQIGLVPLGSGAGKDWPSPFFCRPCSVQEVAGGGGTCKDCKRQISCGGHKFCNTCAAKKRACCACGKAKPWSATFIEGQPVRLELHFRNVGKKKLDIAGANWCDLPNWRLVFRPVGGGAPLLARCTAKLQRAGRPDIHLAEGQQAGRCFVLGKHWAFQPMIMAHPQKALPAGKYKVTVTYNGKRGGSSWQGSVTAGSVDIEVKVKAKAAATTGEKAWQDLFSKQRWYKGRRGAEQVFKGKLVAAGRGGGDSTLMRTSYYKLGDRTIYTGAKKPPALEKLVGRNVEIRGKPVNMNLEGQSLKEIWPAAVRATK